MITEFKTLSVNNEQFNAILTKEIIFQPKLITGFVQKHLLHYSKYIKCQLLVHFQSISFENRQSVQNIRPSIPNEIPLFPIQ